MPKLREIHRDFLEVIKDLPGVNILKLREVLQRGVTLEADRQVLHTLVKKDFIETSKGVFKNWKLYCTETGLDALDSYELEKTMPYHKQKKGKCEKCKKTTEDLIRFRKKDLCGSCLTIIEEPPPLFYDVLQSNFVS